MISRPSVCRSKDYRGRAVEEPLGGKSSAQLLQILPLSLRYLSQEMQKKKKKVFGSVRYLRSSQTLTFERRQRETFFNSTRSPD